METTHQTTHHKHVISFYLFIAIVTVGIVVLQPLTTLAVLFLQAIGNQ